MKQRLFEQDFETVSLYEIHVEESHILGAWDLSDTFDWECEGTANKTALERVPNLYRQSVKAPTQKTYFLLFIIKMLADYDELGILKQQNFMLLLNMAYPQSTIHG